MKLSLHILFFSLLSTITTASALAQPGFKVDIEKPAPYQERKLKSEKTGEGKLKGPKLVMQNLTTHFNYYFNANNKLNAILEQAKEQHKDDYGNLLTFYNYTLDATAAEANQLDSVIYKARTGLANHDLRNEWTDEMYLLWAQSWHLQKKFDSAALMLQFINYAYAPQYEEGFYKAIGTRNEGDRELSIVSKEEKKFLHNNNVSRNTAFIWNIRNAIEMGDLTKAGSLLTTLRRDPALPRRLLNSLDEVEAYWHYAQQNWDSAATHLLATLDGDYNRKEKARWRYLAAQLLEKAGKTGEAVKLYEQVVATTPDPVMEVYARLNLVRLDKSGGEGAIDQNIAELLKMARKDKYEDYRDVIYFMAAQMEMARNNVAAASELLLKGSKYNNGNQALRNKAFLQIADASYDQKKYGQAASFYDSVDVTLLAEADAKRVAGRVPGLKKVVFNNGVVERQDSLQRLAALPEEERSAFVKALAKKLRKQQGLKEETTLSGGAVLLPSNAPPADLFGTSQKGEWYFYNSSAKAQGALQFKSVWGNRPNVDNWRRFAVVSQQVLTQPDKSLGSPDQTVPAADAATASASVDLSYEGLLGNLPISPEATKRSNDSIQAALFSLGMTFLDQLEDEPSAIAAFEELRRRFPNADKMDEVLFSLAYAYGKTGNTAAAAQAKKLLSNGFPASRFATIATTGRDPQSTTALTTEATRAYEKVYNLFLEGQFTEAENAKRIADSTYQTNFWQPQLLYIESVYYIRQRQDSVAKSVLQTIIRQNTNPALSEKAKTMIDVLGRRQQIEDELTRLQITRPSENDSVSAEPVVERKPVVLPKDTVAAVVKKPDPQPVIDTAALAREAEKKMRDSLALVKAAEKQLRDSLDQSKRDSLALAKKQAAKAAADSLAAKTLAAQLRRDSIAQARTAREQARKDSLALAKALRDQAKDSLAFQRYLEKRRSDSLARLVSDSIALVKQRAAKAHADSVAAKALADQQRRDSIALARQAAAQARLDSLSRKALADKQRLDSLAQAKAARDQARRDSLALVKSLREQAQRDSLALARENARIRDSIAKRNAMTSPEGYYYNPAEAHYAVVVLNKVDPIFVSEAKNAFERYNKENFYNQSLEVQILNLSSDTRLLLVSGLPTAMAATDYVKNAKAVAASEIIPWLTGNKYTFSIVSAPNLNILKTTTDMGGYQKFLEQHLPVKL